MVIEQKAFKNPNKVFWLKELVAHFLSSKRISESNLAYFLALAGEVVNFDRFCRNELKAPKKVAKREFIFDSIIPRLTDGAKVLEFGVAHGYTTDYFLRSSNMQLSYFGFDLFTGLPKTWRRLEEGHFSNGGIPPEVSDPRLTWVVGDVIKTFTKDFPIETTGQHVLLFDLDLLLPTAHVFDVAVSIGILKKGTILYFDEAHDSDELSIIKTMLLPKYNCKVIARSWSSIAFEIL
jgi:hypothetical protein